MRPLSDIAGKSFQCTGELLQQYYANLVRTHSKGAYKLDIPPFVEDAVAMSPYGGSITTTLPHEDADEEADSTAHLTSSCAASVTTADDGDGDMESSSDFDSVGEDTSMEKDLLAEVVGPDTAIVVATPRTTAAKRRAASPDESVVEAERTTRPRGRRKLGE